MAPTTDLQLRKYLNSKDIPCSEVEALTGGTANYVWRIRTLLGRSSIVKHAEPYVKMNRNFEFPVDRMDFEARALKELPGILEEDIQTDSKFSFSPQNDYTASILPSLSDPPIQLSTSSSSIQDRYR